MGVCCEEFFGSRCEFCERGAIGIEVFQHGRQLLSVRQFDGRQPAHGAAGQDPVPTSSLGHASAYRFASS